MILDQTVSRSIDKKLIENNLERDKKHKSSGKLSASMLGYPLQWQILKSIKAPRKPFDGYTLRKFLRGVTIEDWLAENTPGLVDQQVFCEYRDTVGYLDLLVDHKDYEFTPEKDPLVPHEVKSAVGMKFMYIEKAGKPDDGHLLQGAFYALALGYKHFAIDYVSADDLRILSYILEIKDYEERINNIIDLYQKTKKTGKVPTFEAIVPWQKNKQYNSYPEWADLTEEEIEAKVKRLGLR